MCGHRQGLEFYSHKPGVPGASGGRRDRKDALLGIEPSPTGSTDIHCVLVAVTGCTTSHLRDRGECDALHILGHQNTWSPVGDTFGVGLGGVWPCWGKYVTGSRL